MKNKHFSHSPTPPLAEFAELLITEDPDLNLSLVKRGMTKNNHFHQCFQSVHILFFVFISLRLFVLPLLSSVIPANLVLSFICFYFWSSFKI